MTEDGKSFCEDVKSTEEYIKIKEETETMIWEAEYQQEPIEASGLLFPIDSLKKVRPMDVSKAEASFLFVDPANKGGDYFAAIFCYMFGKHIYVDKVLCNQDGADVNDALLLDWIVTHKTQEVEYEGVFHWIQNAKALREKVHEKFEDCNYRIVNPTTNKQTRILAQSMFIKNNFLFRDDYELDKQYKKFMLLMTTYLKDQRGINAAKHDDPPDVCAAGAANISKNYSHLY